MRPHAMVYTKPMCRDCDATKTLLRANGVTFTEIDITQDAEALQKVRDFYGFSAAPVVVTAEDAWSGYQPDKIRGIAGEGSSAFGD